MPSLTLQRDDPEAFILDGATDSPHGTQSRQMMTCHPLRFLHLMNLLKSDPQFLSDQIRF
jgi:hypothetical protein